LGDLTGIDGEVRKVAKVKSKKHARVFDVLPQGGGSDPDFRMVPLVYVISRHARINPVVRYCWKLHRCCFHPVGKSTGDS